MDAVLPFFVNSTGPCVLQDLTIKAQKEIGSPIRQETRRFIMIHGLSFPMHGTDYNMPT